MGTKEKLARQRIMLHIGGRVDACQKFFFKRLWLKVVISEWDQNKAFTNNKSVGGHKVVTMEMEMEMQCSAVKQDATGVGLEAQKEVYENQKLKKGSKFFLKYNAKSDAFLFTYRT